MIELKFYISHPFSSIVQSSEVKLMFEWFDAHKVDIKYAYVSAKKSSRTYYVAKFENEDFMIFRLRFGNLSNYVNMHEVEVIELDY